MDPTRITGIGNISAGMKDVLKIGLQGPPRRELGAIHDFEGGLEIADRTARAGEATRVAIAGARRLADPRKADGDTENVVAMIGEQAFIADSAIDIGIDTITAGRITGKPQET